MEYVSPGDAFSSSLEQSLFIRAQQQRQALMDDLASKREDRILQAEMDSAQEHRDRLREHEEELKQKAHDKLVGEAEKRRSKMVPGDIPDPEQAALEDKLGTGAQFFPKPAESMPGIAAVPLGGVRLGMAGPADASVRPYIGSPDQRQDAAVAADQQKYVAGLPDGPQRSALEGAAAMHLKPTADMLKPQDSDGGQPIARIDSKRNVIERLVDGVWTRVAGNVPKGTHFVQEPTPPQPKDTTGRDIQYENQRIAAHNTAMTEINKFSAPLESKLTELETVEGLLNERSTAADAHVAPTVLKALVAGQGSGFRMTKSEIEQVQNARTKWQGMEAALNKWSTDPKKALFFDEQQRGEFLRLVAMVRAAAERHLEPIGRARHDIDTAKTALDIQKRVTGLHDERSKRAKDDENDTTAPKSAADYLKEFNAKAGKK